MKKVLLGIITLLLIASTAHALSSQDVELLISTGIVPADKVELLWSLVSEPVVSPESICVTLTLPLWHGDTDISLNESNEIWKLNDFLIRSGFSNGSDRTAFSTFTKEGVKAFHREVGMFDHNSSEADGYGLVGPKTRAAIRDYSCDPVNSPTYTTPTYNTPAPASSTTPYNDKDYENELELARNDYYMFEAGDAFEEYIFDNPVTKDMSRVCDYRDVEEVLNVIDGLSNDTAKCKDAEYSMAISMELPHSGESYCFDSVGYQGIGKVSKKNGIVYCKAPDVDFDDVEEFYDYLKPRLQEIFAGSLEEARGKGEDAAIKANLNNLRAVAELYYDDQSISGSYGSYDGMCNAERYDNASYYGGGGSDTIDALKELSNDVDCYDYDSSWAASAQLKSTDEYYCVDSSGKAVTTDKPAKKRSGKAYCEE